MLLFIPLLIVTTITSAPTPAPTPSAPPDVKVTISEVKPLRLVEWVARGQKQGQVSLDGAVEVTITNRSDRVAVELRDLDVHGLVFEDPKSGHDHVIVHQCQCVRDLTAPRTPSITLPSGKAHRVTLDEWGCSSVWRPPPPGSYRLSYRVLPAAPAKQAKQGKPARGNPREMVARCRKQLLAPETWRDATSSESLQVVLKAPIRQALPD